MLPFGVPEQMALFDRKVERLQTLPEREFVRELRHLVVEGWLKNVRINPYVKEMLATRHEALAGFREELRPVRRDLISLRQDLVNHRPETADDGEIGQEISCVWGFAPKALSNE